MTSAYMHNSKVSYSFQLAVRKYMYTKDPESFIWDFLVIDTYENRFI